MALFFKTVVCGELRQQTAHKLRLIFMIFVLHACKNISKISLEVLDSETQCVLNSQVVIRLCDVLSTVLFYLVVWLQCQYKSTAIRN